MMLYCHLQDALLTWAPFRQLLLFAFRRKHAAILQQALQQPPASAAAFDELEYYVDPQARCAVLCCAVQLCGTAAWLRTGGPAGALST